MYVFIIQNKRLENEAFGPYDTQDQALGATINYLLTVAKELTCFLFEDFGTEKENIKIITKTKDEERRIAATVNHLE